MKALPETVSLIYDDVAPGPVSLTIDARRDGRSVALDWSDYDEVSNGNDITQYLVYLSDTVFSNISQATLIKTVAGEKNAFIEGLELGNSYFFAVVAEDSTGNSVPAVTSTSVVIEDIVPPQEVSALSVISLENALTFNWQASSSEDLAKFRIYQNGEQLAEVDPDVLVYEITGLERSSEVAFKITAIDTSGNESEGIEELASTWLNNPEGVVLEEDDGKIRISWQAVEPVHLVKRYRIFVQDEPFDSVQSLVSNRATKATSYSVAGLENQRDYYIAVVTENKSAGVDPAVNSYKARPTPDGEGPAINSAVFSVENNNIVLTNGLKLTNSGQVNLTLQDKSGVSQVLMYLDDLLIGEANYDQYSVWKLPLNLSGIADGDYSLSLTMMDTLENTSTASYDVVVDMDAPAIPQVTSPHSGLVTNKSGIGLTGQGSIGSEVQLIQNGQPLTDWFNADETGTLLF